MIFDLKKILPSKLMEVLMQNISNLFWIEVDDQKPSQIQIGL